MSNERWQVIKDGVPVAVCGTIQEADRYYLDFGADEIRLIKIEEEKNMNVKEVFVLEETYKDGDPEAIGAYDSMRAMINGLASRIADDCIADVFGVKGKVGDKTLKAIKSTARSCAKMIPAILHCDFADEECRIGKTVYGYSRLSVEGEAQSDEDGTGEAKEGNG